MAITLGVNAGYGNTAAVASFATGTIQPAANSLMVALIEWSGGDGADPAFIRTTNTTNRYTFSKVAAASTTRKQMWIADSGATPPNDTITAGSWAGGAVTGANMQIIEFIGVDISTLANAIVQAPSAGTGATAGSGTATATTTLAAATNSANRPLAFVMMDLDNAAVTPRASWTQSAPDRSYSTPNQRLASQWRSDTFETSCSATWTSVVAGTWRMQAVELKAAVDTFTVGSIPI